MQMPPGSARPLEAHRQVDAIAEVIAVLMHDIADVDPDTVANPPLLGLGRLAFGHAALDFDCTFDGIDRAPKLDQPAIARELDHLPAVLADQGFEKIDPMGPDPSERTLLVGLHQARVCHDVDGQNRRQLALDARGHGRLQQNLQSHEHRST